MDTLMRQWNLLTLVPRLPAKKTTVRLRDELEERGYPTTLRTVQRDLEKLESEFQLSSDGNRPAGWFWPRDAVQFDIPGMSPYAALVFKMVRRHLGRLLPEACLDLLAPYFRQGDKILADLEPQPLATWPDRVAVLSRTQPLQPPRIDSQVLFAVYDGLLRGRQLAIAYRRRGENQAQERIVNPLGIVVVDQTHYLVATFWHYADLKQLAIHRIEAARILDTAALTPEDFDLQAYVDSGAFGYPEGEELLPLRALFAPDPARQFEETPLSAGQRLTEQADGRILLEAQVRDTAQLRWWLQGFGAQVEILGPPSLREEFAEQIRQLAGRYGVC